MVLPPCDLRPVEPLWCPPPQTYRGPLINQLIEADRRRHIIDACDLRSIALMPERAPEACPSPPEAADTPPPTARSCEPSPRTPPVQRVYEPVYFLGTMLDVFA